MRSRYDNASLLFYSDVKEKKLAARGASHRASRKKGFKGGIRLIHDNLSLAQLRKLNGEVIIYNMYDNILPYSQFKQLSTEDKKKAMNHWLNVKKYTRRQIQEGFGEGVRIQTVHDWISRLGLSKPRLNESRIGGASNLGVVRETKVPAPKPATTLELKLAGEMSGVELRDKITRLDQLISEEQTYVITIDFKELKRGT